MSLLFKNATGTSDSYKIQEALFNVGYMIICNISSSELFSDISYKGGTQCGVFIKGYRKTTNLKGLEGHVPRAPSVRQLIGWYSSHCVFLYKAKSSTSPIQGKMSTAQ